MSKVGEIFEQVRKLGPTERWALMAMMFQLEADGKDDGYDEAWDAEIQRRMDDIDSGLVESVPWERALEQIRTSRTAETRTPTTLNTTRKSLCVFMRR